jgi:hypothetical protein
LIEPVARVLIERTGVDVRDQAFGPVLERGGLLRKPGPPTFSQLSVEGLEVFYQDSPRHDIDSKVMHG